MQQQIHLPPLTKVNKILIITLVVSFVVNSVLSKFVDISLLGILGLSLNGIKSGNIFQLITYPFVNSGLFNVVFTGLLFWFLGSDLEIRWGQKRYVKYLIAATFVNGIAFTLFALFMGGQSALYPYHGMEFLSSAMCVSYACIYPDRIFQFFMIIPVKAKYFCLILAGMNVYQGFFSPAGAQAFGSIVSMIFGALFVFGFKALGDRVRAQAGSMPKMKKSGKKRPHLRLVDDEEKKANPNEPKYWQ